MEDRSRKRTSAIGGDKNGRGETIMINIGRPGRLQDTVIYGAVNESQRQGLAVRHERQSKCTERIIASGRLDENDKYAVAGYDDLV